MTLSDDAVRAHIIEVSTDKKKWVGEDVLLCAADLLLRYSCVSCC